MELADRISEDGHVQAATDILEDDINVVIDAKQEFIDNTLFELRRINPELIKDEWVALEQAFDEVFQPEFDRLASQLKRRDDVSIGLNLIYPKSKELIMWEAQ